MKQKKSKKARSLLLKGRSIGVCSLFLIVFALVSLPIRKTEAQRIPTPKEDGGNQAHDAGPEVGVFYESGRIRISDGEQTIYVKDRNQGATVSVSEYEEAEKTLKLSAIKDNYEWCLNYICENDCGDGEVCGRVKCIDITECKSEQVKNANEILGGDVTEDNILYKINDYLSNHESDMEIEYEDTFGTYYYRGNNVGASRDEIHDGRCLKDEYCPPFIDEETYMRGFDGGKIGEPDTGREKGEYDNPCDITKGEYLPTAEDWQRMLDIYGNTTLDAKDDTIQSKKAGKDIRDVLRIPEAGNIYYFNKQAAKGGASELEDSNYVYKPISNKYIESFLLWLALGENASEEGGAGKDDNDSGLLNKKGVTMRISVNGTEFYDKGNDVAAPVRCFINPELSGQYYTINFETNGGSEIKSKLIKEGSEFSVSSIMEPEKDGYVFVGWYLDKYLTQEVDGDMVINQDTIIYAKRAEKGVFYRNGYIKVTDGINTIYIRDRNVGATVSQGAPEVVLKQNSLRDKWEELQKEYNDTECTAKSGCPDYNEFKNRLLEYANELFGDIFLDVNQVRNYIDHGNILLVKYNIWNKNTCKDKSAKGGDMVDMKDCSNEDKLNAINEITNKEFENYDEAEEYIDNYDPYDPEYGEINTDAFGTYYYRGNNSGVNYYELDLDGNIIMNIEDLIERGFDEGKLTDNYRQSWDNNPCDASKGEYLPTVEDWQTAMDIWRDAVYDYAEYNDDEVAVPGVIVGKHIESDTSNKTESDMPRTERQYSELATDSNREQISRLDANNDGNNLLSKGLSKFFGDMLIPSAGYIFNEEKLSQRPVADNGGKEDDKIDEGFAAKKRNGLQEENNDKGLEDKELEEKEKESTINETEKPKEKNLYEKIYNYGYISLWTDKGINGMVGTLTLKELSYLDESYDKINRRAMPVRCFVKVNKVSFNTNGGSRMDEMEMLGNGTLKGLNIENPIRAGYTFAGWYTDSELTQPFDSSDPVTEDTTLYARWQINNTNNDVVEQQITYNNGGRLRKDKCPGGDFSDSYYDGKCEKSTKTTHNASSTKSPYQRGEELKYDTLKYNPKYSDEMNQAYQYSYYYGITTKESIKEADVNGKLTRVAMAKMLSQYAINVLGMEPDRTRQNKFADVSDKLDSNYDNGVTLAYQLGIMGINMKDNKFRPNDEVSRAEFVTALSRMKYGTKDGKDVYYSTHMNLMEDLGVITVTDPTLNETRGYVMLMLMRAK